MNASLTGRAAGALREGRSLRLVARARLVLPDASEQARARFLIEDALNTADFGDCGRLIVVRRLRLPRLPAGAGSRSVALALERAWREASPRAVAFDDARAPQAEVIFAPDAESARAALLERILDAADAGAWFWPRLVPEFAPGAVPGENASRIIAAALLEPAAWRALAARILRWPEPRIAALVRLLPPEPPADAAFQPLRSAAAAPAEPAAPAPEPAAIAQAPDGTRRAGAPAQPAVPAGTAALRAARLLPGPAPASILALRPGDWRLALLAHAAWTAAHHLPPGPQELAAVARAWEARARGTPDAPGRDTGPRGRPGAAPPQESSAGPPRPAPSVTLQGPLPGSPGRSGAQAPGRRPPPAARHEFPGLPIPWLEDARATACGGLLMLLNPLRHLGFDHWLDLQAPELRRPLAAALLARLADQAGAAPDDPQRELLPLGEEERSLVAESECRWTGHAWPAWLRRQAPREPQRGARALREWSAALRRALRVAAGLGLRRLLRRRAWVSATPTHVDVVLPLAEADLAIRRAGLDADPGWVPWFGRIVAFHYLELPAEPGDA